MHKNIFYYLCYILWPSFPGHVISYKFNNITILFYVDETPTDLANKCVDELERCAEHAANEGYCQYNRKFMMIYCRKTCDLCRRKFLLIVYSAGGF